MQIASSSREPSIPPRSAGAGQPKSASTPTWLYASRPSVMSASLVSGRAESTRGCSVVTLQSGTWTASAKRHLLAGLDHLGTGADRSDPSVSRPRLRGRPPTSAATAPTDDDEQRCEGIVVMIRVRPRVRS
jgi:hypothetical protein